MKYVQVKGPFAKGQEIQINSNHTGIHLDNFYSLDMISETPIVSIQMEDEKLKRQFAIGQTGILEIQDCKVISLNFLQDVNGFIEMEVED